MKFPHLFIACMALMPLMAQAKTIQFTYDEAGNRITRNLAGNRIMVAPTKPAAQDLSDTIDGKNTHVSMDNSTGMVKVDIPAFNTTDAGTVHIYTIPGQQIASADINSAETQLDISTYPNGIYIIHVQLNGQSRSWKIIKR